MAYFNNFICIKDVYHVPYIHNFFLDIRQLQILMKVFLKLLKQLDIYKCIDAMFSCTFDHYAHLHFTTVVDISIVVYCFTFL